MSVMQSNSKANERRGLMSTLRKVSRCALVIFLCVLSSRAQQKGGKTDASSLAPTGLQSGTPSYSVLSINNLTSWINSDGASNRSLLDQGVSFPRGTASVIYQDGYVWGGKAYLDAAFQKPAPSQLVRVGGGTYKSGSIGPTQPGTQAGWILGFGANALPVSLADPEVRVYRIRRDYFVASDTESAADNLYGNPVQVVMSSEIAGIRNQYALDWKEWPVALGAPYIERNGIPGYQPPPPFSSTFSAESLITKKYDEPGIAAASDFPADQVMWTVYNDLDVARSVAFEGSNPLGLEAQVTVWAYKRKDLLGNVVFRRLLLINKGGVDIGGGTKGAFFIDSMYVGQWSDPDIGNSQDDLVGCDSTKGLAFAYNASDDDRDFRQYNLPPPAVGYNLLQGPIVRSQGDTALFDMKRRAGFKNLVMSSFSYFTYGTVYADPPRGNYSTGTGRWYKMLRGFAPLGTISDADIPYAVPPGSPPTRFPLSGDPVTRTGFLDGLGASYSLAPGDRRILLNTGPFSFAPGDTQEVVIAVVAALGGNRLSSVLVLKATDVFAQAVYDTRFSLPEVPDFSVTVSYPNPTQATITVTSKDERRSFSSLMSSLNAKDGSTVADIPLFDDGAHGDGEANDGVFAGSVTLARRVEPLFLVGSGIPKNGPSSSGGFVADQITTAGIARTLDPVILFDNIDGDGLTSPDEYVRYRVTIRNDTPFDLTSVQIAPQDYFQIRANTLPSISAGASVHLDYDPSDASSYLDLQIPVTFTESEYKIPFVILESPSIAPVDFMH